MKNNVAMVRESRGMTQRQLADRTGLNRSVLSLIEHGHRIPKLPVAVSIARVLDADVALLWPAIMAGAKIGGGR